jgi:hypothetical protein
MHWNPMSFPTLDGMLQSLECALITVVSCQVRHFDLREPGHGSRRLLHCRAGGRRSMRVRQPRCSMLYPCRRFVAQV